MAISKDLSTGGQPSINNGKGKQSHYFLRASNKQITNIGAHGFITSPIANSNILSQFLQTTQAGQPH